MRWPGEGEGAPRGHQGWGEGSEREDGAFPALLAWTPHHALHTITPLAGAQNQDSQRLPGE